MQVLFINLLSMWESEVFWGRFYFCYLLLLSSWSSSSLSILHLYLIWNSLSRSSWFVQYWDTKVGVSEDFLSTDLVFRVIAIYQTIEEKTKTVRIIFPLHVTEEESKKKMIEKDYPEGMNGICNVPELSQTQNSVFAKAER